MWRSPVAHLLWEQGVVGSNPITPTLNEPVGNDGFFVYTLSNFFKAPPIRNFGKRSQRQTEGSLMVYYKWYSNGIVNGIVTPISTLCFST